MDPHEMRRFPNLTDALLGIPPWASYFRTLSVSMVVLAFAIAAWLLFARSWQVAGIYILAFYGGHGVIAIVAAVLSRIDEVILVACIVIGALALTLWQGILFLHFFGVWSVLPEILKFPTTW